MPSTFATDAEYTARLSNLDFWWPHIDAVLRCHGLIGAGREPVAGIGGSYPAFLYGDVMVKLFGHLPAWREVYAAERAAHALLTTNPEIFVPRVAAQGRLYTGRAASWPYLVLTRMPGVCWRDAQLSHEERLTVAMEVGKQIRRVHVLPPQGVPTQANWPILDIMAAARQSSLPPRLIPQIEGFLAGLAPFDAVFVHGDLFARHVFVENGHLTGIIDWGDATVTDRHFELAKLHLDTFAGDKTLLRAFLEGSDWPIGPEFPRQALGMALYKQAVGLAQHLTNDTFYLLPKLLPLREIGTLEELAAAVFGV